MLSRMISRLFGRHTAPRNQLSPERIRESVNVAMSVRRRKRGVAYLPGAADRIIADLDLTQSKAAIVDALADGLWREETAAAQASPADHDEYTRYTGYEPLRIIAE